MSRLTHFAVLVAAMMSLFAMLSSSAGAVTWHNTGDTAFTASSTTASSLSVTGVFLTCTGGDATGTAPAGPVSGTTYTLATGSMSFTNCLGLSLPTPITCGYSLTTSTAPVGLVFSGTADILCSVTQFGTEICKIEGQTASSYTNPSGTTAGKLTLSHSSTLRTTNGTGGTCPLGAGEPLTLTTQVFTITAGTGGPTPHLGPKITRTA
jgi:hypothetical protein